MKVVHFSDLHLDSAFAWMSTTPSAARKRRQALRDTLHRIIDLAIDVGADALFCGGDLYEHDRFAPDTGPFLKDAFAKLDHVRVFIAPGNHDWYGPESLYRAVDWPPNVHVFSEAALAPITLDDGLTLWGAAHRGPANTPGFLDDFRVDRGGINVALFHGSERAWFTEQESGKQPHAPFSAPQIDSAGLHHAFLGHFHRPRDHQWFTYPGNPDPLAFGEDGERGAVVAIVHPDGRVVRERTPVAVSQIHDLEVDVTGADSQQDIRARLSEVTNALRGSARVTLNGDLAPHIDIRLTDLADMETSLDAMVVQMGELRESYDVDSILQEPTVRGEFARSVFDLGLPADEERRILITGLRALAGRDDLEVS